MYQNPKNKVYQNRHHHFHLEPLPPSFRPTSMRSKYRILLKMKKQIKSDLTRTTSIIHQHELFVLNVICSLCTCMLLCWIDTSVIEEYSSIMMYRCVYIYNTLIIIYHPLLCIRWCLAWIELDYPRYLIEHVTQSGCLPYKRGGFCL